MFDLSDGERSSFQPLPAGFYPVVSDEAVVKDMKDGKGQMISVKFRVIEGHAEGRVLFQNFTVTWNAGPVKTSKGTEIDPGKLGRGQVVDFRIACGVPEAKAKILDNVMDLVGYKVIAKVKVTEDKGYGPGNGITSFKPYAPSEQGATTSQPF